jgi:mono/diheme cytochrome c family protein
VSSQSAEWNRGAYLVEGLGHCGACHTPRNGVGAEQADKAFTGGTYLDEVADSVHEAEIVKQDGVVRNWSAVNLTSHQTGLSAWSVEEIEAYLKTGHTTRSGAFGPMTAVIQNSTQYLTDADIHAMAVYIKALAPKTGLTGTKIADDRARAGEIVYTVRCGDCHLPTGMGIPEKSESAEKRSPPLVGNAIVQAPDPASLINVILYGAHESLQSDKSWPKMPGFETELGLEDDQIAALCDYLRSAWGNQGDPVDAAAVAKQR